MPSLRRRRLRSTSRSSRYYRWYRRYRRYPRLTRHVRYSNGRESSSINLKVVTNGYFNGSMAAGTNDSAVFCLPSLTQTNLSNTNYAGQISALNSTIFRAYCNLYHEFRLRGVLFEIAVTNPIGTGASDLPAFMIFASVDRRYNSGNTPPTTLALSNYASVSPSTYVSYNRTKFKKYIGARDLIERSQFIDSQLSHNPNAGWYNSAISQAGNNPNFFCPAMYFFVRFPFTLTTAFTVQMSIRATYYLTFRNPAPFDAVPAASGAAASASVEAPVLHEEMGPVDQPFSTSEFLDEDPHLLAGRTTPSLALT